MPEKEFKIEPNFIPKGIKIPKEQKSFGIDNVPEVNEILVKPSTNWDDVESINKPEKNATRNVVIEENFYDDEEKALLNGITGWGFVMAGDNEEWAEFRFNSSNVVELSRSSANVDDADTDGKLCIYNNGSNIVIKNRLGATKIIRYEIKHS